MAENVEEIAIDIHCAKLLDWLISRRICGRSWPEQVARVRRLISTAILDMPERDDVRDMLSGTYLTYYHCLRIVDMLRVTESDSRNVFGRYSSQRMKDWQQIVALYERDNVYLAEAAELLHQFVQYQIPSLKRQVLKLENSEQECEKKTEENSKRCRDMEKLFAEQCRKFGIQGQDVPREIVALADSLPDRLDGVVKRLRAVWPIAEGYFDFQRVVHGSQLSAEDRKAQLAMLRFICERGNTTVFEWNRGVAPSRVDRNEPKLLEDTSTGSADEIDFGEDELLAVTGGEDKIDFEIEELAAGDMTGSDGGDFVVIDSQGASPATSDVVARGSEALTVLECRQTMNLLLADLKEIESFLRMRTVEVGSRESNTLVMVSTVLKGETEGSISRQLKEVNEVIGLLTDPTLRHLCDIRASAQYFQRVVRDIEAPLKRREKLNQIQEALQRKRREGKEQLAATEAQIDLFTRRAKELQASVEADISQRYRNRPVNIIGSTAIIVDG